jgi:MFS family permease
MGGLQAVISVTLVVGPMMAGLAFDTLGVPAPYWIGAVLAASALLAASIALLPGRSLARRLAAEPDVPRGPGE